MTKDPGKFSSWHDGGYISLPSTQVPFTPLQSNRPRGEITLRAEDILSVNVASSHYSGSEVDLVIGGASANYIMQQIHDLSSGKPPVENKSLKELKELKETILQLSMDAEAAKRHAAEEHELALSWKEMAEANEGELELLRQMKQGESEAC